MPPRARIPRELVRAPFSLREARAAGLSASSLKGKQWRRIGASLYCWSGLEADLWSLAAAWRRVLPAEAVFVGRTAAVLHRLVDQAVGAVEVAVSARTQLRWREGLSIWRCDLAAVEVTRVRGLRVTTISRTLLDLCVRRTAVEALIALDAATRRGVRVDADRYKGLPGAARLRRLVQVARPAESPMETRLRWLLLAAGLPDPAVQADLHDAKGRFVGRADLYYPRARLVVEFDGGNHRERLVSDDRRQNLLMGADFRVLRFTAADVYNRPELVVTQVRDALVVASGGVRIRAIGRNRA